MYKLQVYHTAIHTFFKLGSAVVIIYWLYSPRYTICGVSRVALVVKKPAANAGDIRHVASIPLEEGMATHSSILAWRIPWTEETEVHRVAKTQTQLKLFYT